MNGRTDLAMEAAENQPWDDSDIRRQEIRRDGLCITRLHVRSSRAAEGLGKPIGRYVTVEFPALSDDETRLAREAGQVAAELTALLPPSGTVLVVGLGNRTVTPDTLGPAAADMVLATRHIRGEFARAAGLDDLRPTVVITPGVLGQTGAESREIVHGVCREIRPAAVIVMDALAAGHVDRLGRTVQLSDAGISPGSGVGNDRQPLSEQNLGIPVIGMGVPTVVDAATLMQKYREAPAPAEAAGMMVTPREIDLLIGRAARLMAAAVNRALQPAYSPTDLMAIARGI